MQCLDSLRCSIFYTVGHHQLRRKQHTVQGCITVHRLIFEEIVKWGLRGFAAVGLQGCHMFTMLVYEWEVSEQVSEQVGASYQKSYLHVFLSAARGVVI